MSARFRWQDLPPSPVPHVRPQRPLDVRCRAWLLEHGQVLTMALVVLLLAVALWPLR